MIGPPARGWRYNRPPALTQFTYPPETLKSPPPDTTFARTERSGVTARVESPPGGRHSVTRGGAVGMIGMEKAFEEMEALGWIGAKRPKMIAVQAEGCQPVVRDFERGEARSQFWEKAFFFQAEDGIRDLTVTGVQTCALPI